LIPWALIQFPGFVNDVTTFKKVVIIVNNSLIIMNKVTLINDPVE